MAVIDKNQGAIKLSEVAVDDAVPTIATSASEDALTVVERLRRVTSDVFRKHSMLLTTSNTIQWNDLGNLVINSGTTLSLFLLAAPSGETNTSGFNVIAFTPVSNTTWSIANNEIIYIELQRSLLNAASSVVLTDGINAAGTSGRRIRKTTAANFPYVQDLNDGNPEGTLAIPVAVRFDSALADVNLWWAPHGTLWSNNITAYLGRVSSSTTIPIGGIIPIHVPTQTTVGPTSQAVIDALAPGFVLCSGGTVSNINSPMFGEDIPSLNQTGVYQPPTSPATVNPDDTGGQRFIRGGANSNITGGKSAVVLTPSTTPDHSHTVATPNYAGGGISHRHDYFVWSDRVNSSANAIKFGDNDQINTNFTDTTSDAAGHDWGTGSAYYTGDGSNPSDRDHSHGASTSQGGNSGANPQSPFAAPHQNLPLSYSAVFIMRIL